MAPVREGDWMCPGCGNHNFASRASCNRCGGAHPTGGKGGQQSSPFGAVKTQPAPQRHSPYVLAAMPPGGGCAGAGGAALKEGDWLCQSCGNHNFASRVNCNRCGELKQGMKQGDWICRSCKNHNFASKTVCNKCTAPRPADSQPPPARVGGGGKGGCGGMGMMGGMGCMGGVGGMGGMGMMGGGYGGYAGGYGGAVSPVYMQQMPMGKGKAPMASPVVPYTMTAPVSTKPMKEGDWMCPGCGNHNFASRVKCNKCQQIRAGFKEGDWICRDCKNHNFRSREACNKCGNPKAPDQ